MSKALDFAPQRKLDPAVVVDVLMRIAEGETLTAVYASDKSKYPHPATWGDWVAADPAISLAYARARDAQADALAEDCLLVADDATDDVEIRYDAAGKPFAQINGHSVQRAKLIIETRLKLLSKWHHVKYGEKLLHAGHDGGILKAELAVSLPELAERLRDARRAAGAGPVIEHQPRGPEPSTTALLDADVVQPVPTHNPAPLLHDIVEQHGADGMEFV